MPLPSMSKIDLLWNCQWWANPNVVVPRVDPGEAARYGSAFHLLLASWFLGKPMLPEKAAKQFGIPRPKQLHQHALEAARFFTDWLRGNNELGIKFTPGERTRLVEVSFALDPVKMEARHCDPPTEDTHEYKDRRPGEICGTADLVIIPQQPLKTAFLADHKTGQLVSVEKAGQLKGLALALYLIYGVERVITAVFHAPVFELPEAWVTEHHRTALLKWGRRLAKKMSRVESGTLRPGDWCQYCPALPVCPTKTTGLVHLGFKGKKLTTPDQVGRIHMARAEYRALDELLGKMEREYVKKHGPVPLPNGKVLALEPRTRRTLSMASIKRALGSAKGEIEIQRLESKGCVETTEYVELRATNND